jgi:hypothetical protein
MAQVLGTRSAELLVSLGIPRQDVIAALMREIGLTHAEAERAWRGTASSHPAVRNGRLSRV